MGPAELAWRVGQRLALERWKAKAGRPAPALPVPAGGFREAFREASRNVGPVLGAAAFEQAFPGETARVIARADAVGAGRVELFARTYEFGSDPARWPWNRDPSGGPEVPTTFGPTLDYRDPAKVGDARLAWELGRHGFLVPFGQAAFLTGDPRWARAAFGALEAWQLACPPYAGIQWASALEYALRAFAWGHALALIARSPAGEAIEDARWERVLASWAEQMRFVFAHDARHSSANNHRLGEAAGLAWSGRQLAFLPEAAAWHARGLAVLEECVLAQTTQGGMTREHAFAYQQFVLDFAVVVEALEVRHSRALPGPVRERIGRIAAALDAVSPGGRTFAVGDGDEGQALPTGEPFERRVSASVECAARLTGGAFAGEPSPRAAWLGLTDAPAKAGADAPATFVEAGYAARRKGAATVLFDAAELGLAPLYAHGHADALMVLFDEGGPRLVDPGTGGYHAHAALRERLRATRAHNTVEVDGVSQSTPGGLFQWLKAARVSAPLAVDGETMTAAIELASGVRHRRTVRWTDALEVVDVLEGAGTHRAVARWHLGDGRATAQADGSFLARWPDGYSLVLRAELPQGGTARAGDDATWAPRFLEPRPCGVVEWHVEGRLPLAWRTRIERKG